MNKLLIIFTIISTIFYSVKSYSQDLFNTVDERITQNSDVFCSDEDDSQRKTVPQINKLRNITYTFNEQKVNFNIPNNYKFIEFVAEGYNFLKIINAQDIDDSKCSFSQGMGVNNGLGLSYESENINDQISSLKDFKTKIETVTLGKNKDIKGYKYYWTETGCFINYLIPLNQGYISIGDNLNANLDNWSEECKNPSRLKAIEQTTLDLFLQSLIIE